MSASGPVSGPDHDPRRYLRYAEPELADIPG